MACGAASSAPAGAPAPAPAERSADEALRAGSREPAAAPIVAVTPPVDGELVETWEGSFGAGRDLSLTLVLESRQCYRVRVAAPGGALFGTLDDEHGHRLASARGEDRVDLLVEGLCPRWTGSFALEVDGPGALRHARVELFRVQPQPSALTPRLPSDPLDEAALESASDP